MLASHAAKNRLAIVDTDQTPYSYAELLSRATVFHEHLVAGAQKSGKQLEGARIGLLVPPGVDFIAAVLSIWISKAIVGRTSSTIGTLDSADRAMNSANMFYTSFTGDDIHCNRFGSGLHYIPLKFSIENRTTAGR